METVRWDELIPDDQREEENRSDVEFERQWDRISKDARKRCNEDPNEELRTMPHQDIGLRVPKTEASLTLKLAKKNQNRKDQSKV